MTAKVVFSQGRRKFAKDGKLSKPSVALSQKIEAAVRGDFVNSGKAEAAAAVYRKFVQGVAKSYYKKTLEGCQLLVKDSKTKAVYEGTARKMFNRVHMTSPNFENRGSVFVSIPMNLGLGKDTTNALLGNFSGSSDLVAAGASGAFESLVKQGLLEKLARKGSAEQSYRAPVVVSTLNGGKLRWKKLRMDYYYKSPKSVRFYDKSRNEPTKLGRWHTGAVSARGAFLALGPRWQSTANTLRDKRGVQKLDPATGSASFQFQIEYPKLQDEWDFLRQAFVRARWYELKYSGSNSGDRGIIYAEMMRPLLRPYAIAMGRRFRETLKSMK